MTNSVIIRRIGPSNGARALREALANAGVRALLSEDGRARRRAIVLNWGSTEPGCGAMLNSSSAVNTARNKLSTFQALALQGFSFIPKFWTSRQEAEDNRGKSIILERHSLTGQSGSGIVVKRQGEALAEAPLYVQYVRKLREFRVHVWNGSAIAVQEKRRESDNEQTANQKLIRNRDNGWVFCVNDIVEPANLRTIAADACDKLGLDFGAVDMIEAKDGSLYVLEVNTKPGLESPTVLAAYAEKIKEAVNGRT